MACSGTALSNTGSSFKKITLYEDAEERIKLCSRLAIISHHNKLHLYGSASNKGSLTLVRIAVRLLQDQIAMPDEFSKILEHSHVFAGLSLTFHLLIHRS
jgi:hypothetical protein